MNKCEEQRTRQQCYSKDLVLNSNISGHFMGATMAE